jgi:Uma2 family endonuclease
MSAAKVALPKIAFAEYLDLEQRSQERHEFVDGVVVAMAGEVIGHARVAGNCYRFLGNALMDHPCEAFGSDTLVVGPSGRDGFYPDVSAHCGELDSSQRYLTQPTLVIEVLSPSTRSYDLTTKLAAYKIIASLRHILYLEYESIEALLYSREPLSTWPSEPVRYTSREDHVPLSALNVQLPLRDVYARVFDTDR